MKKILSLAMMLLPFLVMGQGTPEAYGAPAGMSPVWSVFGWMMMLAMAVWLVVGVFGAIWLWQKINK